MSNRDEFSQKTKDVLRLRASNLCSFRGCKRTTSGPSDESPDAVNMTGKAAHIHAAAPGGRRYLAAMTPEERADISNGIWVCAHHADLIDRDEVTYTADLLRAMKREHELNCDRRHRDALQAGEASPDLVAIGPDIIFCGEFLGADRSQWRLHLEDFVDGDLHNLLTFIERFDRTPTIDRYVLINSFGDGRVLSAAPSISKEPAGGYTLTCAVFPSAERISAAELPTDFALSEDHDLMPTENGGIAEVAGVDALPQTIKTCLSSQKGESPFHKDFGTRFAEYFRLLAGSPWFEQILKLEVIRQAAIPYIDPLDNRQYTPFLCVERVYGIELLADVPSGNWLPIRVDLEVRGLGRWQRELSVCVPKEEAKRSSWDELMAGPLPPIQS
ncbi:MAG TPA: hypothetical protein VNJ49_03305 [Bradyrhizobium sp.]|jgi:hypothetical protein|nr:hypothetical protein [Bradyrhizobium sp.]